MSDICRETRDACFCPERCLPRRRERESVKTSDMRGARHDLLPERAAAAKAPLMPYAPHAARIFDIPQTRDARGIRHSNRCSTR